MSAVADERDIQDGAFLGGLLKTRYGAGLIEHIRELLTRLSQRRIYSRRSEIGDSLLDAFFLLALPHAANVRTMTARVLAMSLDIAEQEVFGAIVLPLGDEAAISLNADIILVRHGLIARSACNLAPELGVDLGAIAERIVRAAVSAIENYGISNEYRELAYLSRHLADHALAVRAATAAVEAAPRRLSYRTSLSRAFRIAGDPGAAVLAAEGTLSNLWSFDDLITGARPMFTEWGFAEGNLGRWARHAVLAGISLQDMEGWARPYAEQQSVGIVCCSVALRKLWEASGEAVFLNALAGIAEIGQRIALDTDARRRIGELRDIVIGNGAAVPRDLGSASHAIGEACRAAWGRVEAPFPNGLPPRRFRFDGLASMATEGS